jgi:citrate lyase subunit beta/citryl-CoA lyase
MMPDNIFSRFYSYLFVPVSDERILRSKAYARAAKAACALIIDLEDSLHPTAKEVGRTRLKDAVEFFSAHNPNIFVRINADVNWQMDLDAVAGSRAAGILVPKVENITQLARAKERIGRKVDILPLFETPRGISKCASILSDWRDSRCAFFGCEDFAAELGILEPTINSVGFAAQQLIHAGAAHGVPVAGSIGPFSAIHSSLRTEFISVMKLSRDIGFAGSFVVHPAQIDAVNRVFSYIDEQDKLKEIIAACEDRAVFLHDGKMVGPPMLKRYRKILAKSDH